MGSSVAIDLPARPVGDLLREWRQRRRLSQLELSVRAEVSTRHLSFIETGRSRPTPEMIIRLTEQLEVPLRQRNRLLLAGGYAPAYPERPLDDPALANVRQALRLVLDAHEPHPAVLIDRRWTMLEANAGIGMLVAGCAPHLLEPPVNVLRLSLHPDGLASRIVNLAQWRGNLLARITRRVETTGDDQLRELLDELCGYPGGADSGAAPHGVVVPLRITDGPDELSFFSIASVVETAADVTVDELVLESFHPADPATAARLAQRAATSGSQDAQSLVNR